MSLSRMWIEQRDQLADKQVHQIIAFAGQGRLKDGSAAAAEFREFLHHVSSTELRRYATSCLTDPFQDSGLALQDIVNEIGRRVGFVATDGRYRGVRGDIGFDGLWRNPEDGHHLVVEVKTTDAYRIATDTVAGYQGALARNGTIAYDKSSILVVVGRKDTGDLEAQIRGSRHAWDIRIVSVEALLRLMELKEELDDPAVIHQIRTILVPREFTRLDSIIDLVFFAANEAKGDDDDTEDDQGTGDDEEDGGDDSPPTKKRKGSSAKPVSFHHDCIQRYAQALGQPLIRRSRSTYSTPDDTHRVVCAVSKEHTRKQGPTYWVAFHPHQKTFLEGGDEAHLLLGCGDATNVLAIPLDKVRPVLDTVWTTERDGRAYWHFRIRVRNGRYMLHRRKGHDAIDLSAYLLAHDDPSPSA